MKKDAMQSLCASDMDNMLRGGLPIAVKSDGGGGKSLIFKRLRLNSTFLYT